MQSILKNPVDFPSRGPQSPISKHCSFKSTSRLLFLLAEPAGVARFFDIRHCIGYLASRAANVDMDFSKARANFTGAFTEWLHGATNGNDKAIHRIADAILRFVQFSADPLQQLAEFRDVKFLIFCNDHDAGKRRPPCGSDLLNIRIDPFKRQIPAIRAFCCDPGYSVLG